MLERMISFSPSALIIMLGNRLRDSVAVVPAPFLLGVLILHFPARILGSFILTSEMDKTVEKKPKHLCRLLS